MFSKFSLSMKYSKISLSLQKISKIKWKSLSLSQLKTQLSLSTKNLQDQMEISLSLSKFMAETNSGFLSKPIG